MNTTHVDARLSESKGVIAAPFWRRLCADLVDLFLLFLIGYLLWNAGVLTPDSLPEVRFDWIDYTAQLFADHRASFYPFMTAVWLSGCVIVLGARASLGASVGERLLGLQIVNHQGEQASRTQWVLHLIGTQIGLLLLLQGYVWAAVDKNRQGAANYLSATLLVVVSRD